MAWHNSKYKGNKTLLDEDNYPEIINKISNQLTLNQGMYVNMQNANPGTPGYIKFAVIRIIKEYADHPCVFIVSGRGRGLPAILNVRFQNNRNDNPGVTLFHMGGYDYPFYIARTGENIYSLYGQKNEAHGTIEVLNAYVNTMWFEVTYPNEFVGEAGPDWIESTPGGECVLANGVRDLWNNKTLTFSIGKPAMARDAFDYVAVWDGYELRASSKVNFMGATGGDDGHYGMATPAGETKAWIRVPEYGFLPFRQGNIDSPVSNLGTDAWWFSSSYIATMSSKITYTDDIISRQKTNYGGSNGLQTGQSMVLLRPDYIAFHNNDNYGSVTFGAKLYTTLKLSFQPNRNGIGTIGDASYKWNQFYATNATISTSDKKEKEEISYIGQESSYEDTCMTDEMLIKLILGLKPVIFKRINGESGRPHHGLIAQDFEKLLKEIGLHDHAAFIKSPKTVGIEEEVEKEVQKEIQQENGTTKIVTETIKEKTVRQEVIPGEYVYGIRYEELKGDLIRFCQILYNKNASLEKMVQGQAVKIAALEDAAKAQEEKTKDLEERLKKFEELFKPCMDKDTTEKQPGIMLYQEKGSV